jgi:hypothetical protein
LRHLGIRLSNPPSAIDEYMEGEKLIRVDAGHEP